jgi:hypothetical protein
MVAALSVTACQPRGEEPDPGDAGEVERPLQGLSSEQIERQAEPLSPEQAAERGIVDTTVHVAEEP